MRQRFAAKGGLALAVAIFTVTVAAVGTTDSGSPRLVAYYVTWFGRADGLKQYPNECNGSRESCTQGTEKVVSELTGSAIVRFDDYGGGHLGFHDTRYLKVVALETVVTLTSRHDITWTNGGTTAIEVNCLGNTTHIISNSDAYSGRVVSGQEAATGLGALFCPPGKDFTTFGPQDSLLGLESMSFDQPWESTSNCEYALPLAGPRVAASGVMSKERLIVTEDIGSNSSAPAWRADPKDPSSFSINAHYIHRAGEDTDGDVPVQWTATAHLMGKCAAHAWPIQDADPVIGNQELVEVDAAQSEIAPDGHTTVKVRVTCEQVPIEGAAIEVELKPQESSGGHTHTGNRPRGSLNGKKLTDEQPSITVKTDANGEAALKFEPPIVGTDYANYGAYKIGIAGIYNLKATSTRFPDSSGAVAVSAAVKGLVPMGAGSSYAVERGGMNSHPEGTLATPGTRQAFIGLADNLYKYQTLHNVALRQCGRPAWLDGKAQQLSVNDVALPAGGLFDFHDNWKPGHQTHNRGEGGDFNRFLAVHGTGTECDGSAVNIRTWLLHTLIELGTAYGHWDCTDFGNGSGCVPGQPQGNLEFPSQTWVPPDLHLHVED